MPYPPCNRAATGAFIDSKTVPWKGNFFCTSSLVSHTLGTRKGKVLVRLSEFLRVSMGNCYSCLLVSLLLSYIFQLQKWWTERSSSLNWVLPICWKAGPQGPFYFDFIPGEDLFQGPLDLNTQFPTQARVCGIICLTGIMFPTILYSVLS